MHMTSIFFLTFPVESLQTPSQFEFLPSELDFEMKALSQGHDSLSSLVKLEILVSQPRVERDSSGLQPDALTTKATDP